MKNELIKRLKAYRSTANQSKIEFKNLEKLGFVGTAALAAMVSTPVELSSQVVCGNGGAPVRTIGSCTGDIGFLSTYNCAKIDFDGDGINELQIYYYNWSGVGSTAYAYIDPINNDLALFGKGNFTSGYTFPGNPIAQAWNYYLMYQDRIYVVPLSGGAGYGFVTFDSAAHPAGTNHPQTGQPICCYHSALPTMWGSQTGISSLSEITINSSNLTECPQFPVLPIELSKFEVLVEEESIRLEWTTESEINNSGFAIERSMDGKNFEEVAFVNGAGNSSQTEYYTYEDKGVKSGNTYYYRLRQIDYDGRSELSDLKSVEILGKRSAISVGPNPSSDFVHLYVTTDKDEECSISLFNNQGELIKAQSYTMVPGENQKSLDVSSLPTGFYFLKAIIGNVPFYERITIN